MREQVNDPDLVEKLTPSYAIGCKRPSFHNTYLSTFNRENVALETNPIEAITPAGIRTADGAEHEIDVLVLATGFKVFDPGNFPKYPVSGRGGEDLETFWRVNRFQAYEGVSVPSFPNYFTVFGPYGYNGASYFNLVETQSHHIVRALAHARDRGASLIEVKKEANDRYFAEMLKRRGRQIFWQQSCGLANSYYFDDHGDVPLAGGADDRDDLAQPPLPARRLPARVGQDRVRSGGHVRGGRDNRLAARGVATTAKGQPKAERAVRATVRGQVTGVGFRAAVVDRADELGVLGWVRNDDGEVLVHAEGDEDAVAALLRFLGEGPAGASVEAVEHEEVKAEGHEQFAVRGVSAGVFVVQEHHATSHHFDLRLEVGGVMKSWAVPKGPSMDPGTKRMAIEVPDHSLEHNEFEGELGEGSVLIWDRGTYEQGGRVPWPEAIERGHAVFVLHGVKLSGGFALQRTRGSGEKAQWLLIKRKDDEARPGSDVVAEQPGSVT